MNVSKRERVERGWRAVNELAFDRFVGERENTPRAQEPFIRPEAL